LEADNDFRNGNVSNTFDNKKNSKTADKQFIKLLENPKTILLQLKKMQGHPDIWEIRITKEYRTTLQIENDLYRIRKIGTHDILKNP